MSEGKLAGKSRQYVQADRRYGGDGYHIKNIDKVWSTRIRNYSEQDYKPYHKGCATEIRLEDREFLLVSFIKVATRVKM